MSRANALVVGAGGGIANALLKRLVRDAAIDHIFAISSRHSIAASGAESATRVTLSQCNYSDADISEQVAMLSEYRGQFSHVFICNGILHKADTIYPEKRLEDIKPEALMAVFAANSIVPMLWLKHLCPLLQGTSPCRLAAFSARVGSIGDNRLGGWYSYRASKAALNMLLQTAAVEFARRAKNVKLIAFHPGTTDTALSKPFQANVPPGKLFSADFVAERLLGIMANIEIDGRVSYLDWEGKSIAW